MLIVGGVHRLSVRGPRCSYKLILRVWIPFEVEDLGSWRLEVGEEKGINYDP